MATQPKHSSKQKSGSDARSRSREIFERGCRILVGGVDSPVRAFRAVGGTPLVIERAEGARLYDVDGREYIDYVCSWGALILGHAHADVLAAVSYLHRIGVRTVSAVGASMGGDAVGEADAMSKPGNIARVAFLGSSGGSAAEKLNGRKLYIVARNDRSGDGLRLPEISSNYEKASQPKELVILEGSAHAQYLFDTDQGPRLLSEILRFLSAP